MKLTFNEWVLRSVDNLFFLKKIIFFSLDLLLSCVLSADRGLIPLQDTEYFRTGELSEKYVNKWTRNAWKKYVFLDFYEEQSLQAFQISDFTKKQISSDRKHSSTQQQFIQAGHITALV